MYAQATYPIDESKNVGKGANSIIPISLLYTALEKPKSTSTQTIASAKLRIAS